MNKDKLILKDNTIIELETGADLSNLSVMFHNKEEMMAIGDQLSKENLSEVTIQNGSGLIVGSYTDLVLAEPNLTATELPDGAIKGTFRLLEKTEMEEGVQIFKDGQAVQEEETKEIEEVRDREEQNE